MRKKKDTRQLLIESAEFSTSIKLSKELVESLQMSKGKTDTLIVKNIPCTILNRENQNGRIYSTEVVQTALDEAKKLKKFEQKQLLSQADEHPESSFIPPSHASHVVINSYIKPNVKLIVEGRPEVQDVLFMDWEVLNTQEGKNLRALFEAGVSIGVSIRGVGDLNGKYVENYEILGCDCVGQPSSSTYTNMPVSESVEYDINKKNKLTETFNVSTSSTNVVRDLERASEIQAQLENIGYGTVTKTSTKVDDETDPKTGARTSITTLEAETSDEVSDLDQALSMAKNAMLNGVVNVDSITIENIKDEDAKESAHNHDENTLKEEDEDDTERYEVCAWCGEKFPLSDLKKEKDLGYICNQCAKGIESREGPLNFEEDYIPESKMSDVTMTEANDKKPEDANVGKKFVLKTPNGFVAMDGNALVFKDNPEDALHFIKGKEESGLVHLSGVEKILDTMGVYDVEKYFKHDITDISAPDENKDEQKEGLIGGIIGGVGGATLGGSVAGPLGALGGASAGYSLGSEIGDDISDSTIKDKDTKLEEENGSNTRYSAEVTINNGAAGESKDVIPVSGVEMNAIVAEVSNLYKMKADNTEGNVSIVVTDTQNNQKYQYNPQTNTLDPIQQQVPQQEASNNEIKQNGNKLSMELDDKANIDVEKAFDSPLQASVVKAGLERGKLPGDIMMTEEGNAIGVDLTSDVNYNNTLGPVPYTLWFKCDDTTFDLLCKDLDSLYKKKKIWNWQTVESMPNVAYVTGLNEKGCNNLLNNLRKLGNNLVSDDFMQKKDESVTEAEEEKNSNKVNRRYEDIEPGWYVGAMGVGVTGPYKSKEEAMSGLEDVADLVSVEYISADDIQANESAEMKEILFNKPSEPSDPVENKPLQDDVNEDTEQETQNTEDMSSNSDSNNDSVKVVLSNIDWDIDSIDKATDDTNFQSTIENLPEELTVEISADELDSQDDVDKIRELMLNAANTQTGLVINNATIKSIE